MRREVPSVEQVVAYWCTEGLAESTVRTYAPLLQRFLDHLVLHGSPLDEPDPFVVRSWARSLQGGRATLAQAKAVVAHWCTVVGCDDVSGSVPVPREQHRPTRALSDQDTTRLLEVARQAGLEGLAVLVAVFTAARRSEVASLAWPRVDVAGGWITLQRDKVKDLHTVPLHPELAEHLQARAVATGRDWSWRHHGSPWVFPGAHDGHVASSTVWTWVKRVAAQAGVECTPHQLRHTALTRANDATGNLRAAQVLAGHRSPEVTARYTRASDDALRSAVGSLDW